MLHTFILSRLFVVDGDLIHYLTVIKFLGILSQAQDPSKYHKVFGFPLLAFHILVGDFSWRTMLLYSVFRSQLFFLLGSLVKGRHNVSWGLLCNSSSFLPRDKISCLYVIFGIWGVDVGEAIDNINFLQTYFSVIDSVHPFDLICFSYSISSHCYAKKWSFF